MPANLQSRHRGRPPGSRSRTPILEDQRLAVRVDEAAAMVGCGLSKMKMLLAEGTVESMKVGAMRLVKVASLRRLIGVE